MSFTLESFEIFRNLKNRNEEIRAKAVISMVNLLIFLVLVL